MDYDANDWRAVGVPNQFISTGLIQQHTSPFTGIMLTRRHQFETVRLGNRYNAPNTSVSDRIDQLILDESGRDDLLRDRREQAKWLRETMATHWPSYLPQPFVGFDLEDGLFVASWQSSAECNTLTIDAKNHQGWYDPWPGDDHDNPLPEAIDLDTEEAWQQLRTALTGIPSSQPMDLTTDKYTQTIFRMGRQHLTGPSFSRTQAATELYRLMTEPGLHRLGATGNISTIAATNAPQSLR
jgi:hypothetical protein